MKNKSYKSIRGHSKYLANDRMLQQEFSRSVLFGTREGRSAIELAVKFSCAPRTITRVRSKLRAEGLLD